MADYASIARPYAKAVFELASEAKSFAPWTELLEKLSVVASDEQFLGLLNDPKVSADQIADLLNDIAGTLPDGGDNFIRLIVGNGRATALAEIQSQFADLVAKAENAIVAEVSTAIALTDAQKDALAKALSDRLAVNVSIEESIDESLLGGAIIRCGDLVIDGSAKGRLEKLASALA